MQGLQGDDGDLDKRVEDGKKQFAGIELPRHTLGVIGLGKIGSLVADAAIKLGMNVLGYDPEITVDAAWSLPSQVRKAPIDRGSAEGQRFRHAARAAARRDAQPDRARGTSSRCAPGAILLNFSRDGIVDDDAVLKRLRANRLRSYVCDFPAADAARRSRAWSRCRTSAPRRARRRTTAR